NPVLFDASGDKFVQAFRPSAVQPARQRVPGRRRQPECYAEVPVPRAIDVVKVSAVLGRVRKYVVKLVYDLEAARRHGEKSPASRAAERIVRGIDDLADALDAAERELPVSRLGNVEGD